MPEEENDNSMELGARDAHEEETPNPTMDSGAQAMEALRQLHPGPGFQQAAESAEGEQIEVDEKSKQETAKGAVDDKGAGQDGDDANMGD